MKMLIMHNHSSYTTNIIDGDVECAGFPNLCSRFSRFSDFLTSTLCLDFGAGSFPAWAHCANDDGDEDDVEDGDGDDGVGNCKDFLLVECFVAKRGHELHPGALGYMKL